VHPDDLLADHPEVRIERPPLLWDARADRTTAGALLDAMIAAALARNGGRPDEITVNLSNVIVEPSAADPLPAGELVAITVAGAGRWGPEGTWRAGDTAAGRLLDPRVDAALPASDAVFAYVRSLGEDAGSVTVLFPREAG